MRERSRKLLKATATQLSSTLRMREVDQAYLRLKLALFATAGTSPGHCTQAPAPAGWWYERVLWVSTAATARSRAAEARGGVLARARQTKLPERATAVHLSWDWAQVTALQHLPERRPIGSRQIPRAPHVAAGVCQ